MYTVDQQHGHATDSTIKAAVDNWYSTSNLTNYGSFINSNAVYCNDRSVGSGTWSSDGETFSYASKLRLSSDVANYYPTYKCGGDINGTYYESAENRLEDKFSATNVVGNGYLTYPVGLMTADEVVFVGGKQGEVLESPYSWYYSNDESNSITDTKWWWTMTPLNWVSNTAKVFGVASTNVGRLNGVSVSSAGTDSKASARPVISLDADRKSVV